MKKTFLVGALIFSTSLVAGAVILRDIRLTPGESILVGDKRISCHSGPSNERPSPSRSSEASEVFYFNGQEFQTFLSGGHGMVRNEMTGEEFSLGCCLIKAPKAALAGNQVVFFGVGTDRNLYYQAGLGNGRWINTGGALKNGDEMLALNLEGRLIVFGIGTDNYFYSAEFSSEGQMIEGWKNLSGAGPRIVGVYPNGSNDYRLVVIGEDGARYSRTRNSGFQRMN